MVENVEKKLPNAKGIMMNLQYMASIGAFNQQANQDHCLDKQEEELSKKQKASKTGLKCQKSC